SRATSSPDPFSSPGDCLPGLSLLAMRARPSMALQFGIAIRARARILPRLLAGRPVGIAPRRFLVLAFWVLASGRIVVVRAPGIVLAVVVDHGFSVSLCRRRPRCHRAPVFMQDA